MSFFRRPVRNTGPCREASPEDILKYLLSDCAKGHTEHLRTISDSRHRSRFKADHFDHIPDPAGLIHKLAREENFETILAFRSPSGDGVKWIVSLPTGTRKPDGTPFTSYDAKYGAPTSACPKVFFRYFYVNTTTGEKSGEVLLEGKLATE